MDLTVADGGGVLSNVVDRRKFLTYTGAAGAATGAAWIAPSVLGSTTAFATGTAAHDCATPQVLHWANYTSSQIPNPNMTGMVSGTVTVPANGSNPAIDVKVTIAPIGTPGQGSYTANNNTYTGTGGIDFAGTPPPNAATGTGNSYYMMFMNNNALNEGYAVTFDFYDTGTTTPRQVYNLRLSIQALTNARQQNQWPNPTTGYDDTVWLTPGSTQTTFTSVKGSAVDGTGTSTSPWVGTTGSNTNAGIALTGVAPMSTFTVNYTGGKNYHSVSEWIWIEDLSWC